VRYVCQIMQDGQSYCFPQLITVLPFSCSCLVSSSHSEVGQFSFECCPLVQELALQSTTYPALEVASHCVCLLIVQCWDFSSLHHPLSLGQVKHATCPLCCSCLITVRCLFFIFARQFGFGCCSVAEEISSVIHYPLCFRE
jgi:hypothetical protein